MEKQGFRFPITTLAGASVRNFMAVCKGRRIEWQYYGKWILTLLVSLIFEILNFIERLIWQRRISSYRLKEPPVFIIGPWRSGTTLLHNLLCQDPNAAYTTTFHAVFPNLVLTQAGWLKPIINKIGPSKRPFDNVSMDMDFPQEDEFGMLNLQPGSIYKFFIFPKAFDEIINLNLHTGDLPDKELATWKRKYGELLAKAVINTGGKRYISKNPCHLGRLGLILKIYPDAKFIFIHRDPYKTVESLYRFFIEIFPGVQLQRTPPDFSREDIVKLYEKVVRIYLKDRHLVPPENLIEMRMEDLLDDPIQNIRKIYDKFDLPGFEATEPALIEFLGKEGPSRSDHFEIEEETIRLVSHYLSDVVGLLGYELIAEYNADYP